MCDKYLLSYYKQVIIEMLKDPNEDKHFSVNIGFIDLIGVDLALGKDFLEEPEKALQEWDMALRKVQTDLILQLEDENIVYKKNCHCRMYKLPLYPEYHRIKFPQKKDANKFLGVSGTVIRTTAIKMLEYQRQYICTKCKYVMTVTSNYEMNNIIVPPRKCTNPKDCQSTNIVNMGERDTELCKDYQEIKIQETVSKLAVGSIPSSMWVTLEDDLVDSCKPGDNITVCGFVKRRQNQFYVGKKMETELVMKANYVSVDNANSSSISVDPELKCMFQAFWKTYSDRPLVARDIILKSFCPQLFGLFTVKLAMAVVLAGGSNSQKNYTTGVKTRAEPHLLLVGDPGTGKSQLLRFASKIIPRSVLTTGVGSTAAGLTVAAVKENGEWQLESGALVMSDGGICCIDEFNTMKEHDRTCIHEAMEQQRISVAKASIVCKLSTRCSILASTNPKGNLDPSLPLNMNVALASPLLSRFDLILLIRDKIDKEWDSQLVDYIFSSDESSFSTNNINWSVETLQVYYAVIKNIHPVLTDESNRILSSYYQAQRRRNCGNKSRTTVRLLDSLVRLSQGHARFMCHREVQIMDAVVAVILVETTTERDSAVFNLHFDVRSDFPCDPMTNYRELVEIVLKKLNLNDLLQKELVWLDSLKSDRTNCPEEKQPEVQNQSKSTDIRKTSQNVIQQTSLSTSQQELDNSEVKITDTENDNRKNSGSLLARNGVHSDLAALRCMPSVNDIFPEGLSLDVESGFVSDFESAETASSSNKRARFENENSLESGEVDNVTSLFLNKGSTQTVVSIKEKRSSPTIVTPSTREENKSLEMSQRTRTRNFFNRFRITVKNDEAGPGRKQDAESKENDSDDISFANVESSTQMQVQSMTRIRPDAEPSSLFETPGDLDDLDLDI